MYKYFTIYKTTNLCNGKYYIGQHRTNNVNDDYLGSGIILKDAIKKYGKNNFKKEVLFIFNNEYDMNEKEIELIDEILKNKDSNCYNCGVGGRGGPHFKNKTHSEKTRRSISLNSHSHTEECKLNLRKYAAEHKQDYSDRSKEYWKKFTEKERKTEIIRRRAKALREKDIKKYGAVLITTENTIAQLYNSIEFKQPKYKKVFKKDKSFYNAPEYLNKLADARKRNALKLQLEIAENLEKYFTLHQQDVTSFNTLINDINFYCGDVRRLKRIYESIILNDIETYKNTLKFLKIPRVVGTLGG